MNYINDEDNKQTDGYKRVARRLSFYSKWLSCMDKQLMESATGTWVRERIHIYTGILSELQVKTAFKSKPVGNYKAA